MIKFSRTLVITAIAVMKLNAKVDEKLINAQQYQMLIDKIDKIIDIKKANKHELESLDNDLVIQQMDKNDIKNVIKIEKNTLNNDIAFVKTKKNELKNARIDKICNIIKTLRHYIYENLRHSNCVWNDEKKVIDFITQQVNDWEENKPSLDTIMKDIQYKKEIAIAKKKSERLIEKLIEQKKEIGAENWLKKWIEDRTKITNKKDIKAIMDIIYTAEKQLKGQELCKLLSEKLNAEDFDILIRLHAVNQTRYNIYLQKISNYLINGVCSKKEYLMTKHFIWWAAKLKEELHNIKKIMLNDKIKDKTKEIEIQARLAKISIQAIKSKMAQMMRSDNLFRSPSITGRM